MRNRKTSQVGDQLQDAYRELNTRKIDDYSRETARAYSISGMTTEFRGQSLPTESRGMSNYVQIERDNKVKYVKDSLGNYSLFNEGTRIQDLNQRTDFKEYGDDTSSRMYTTQRQPHSVSFYKDPELPDNSIGGSVFGAPASLSKTMRSEMKDMCT